jgi:hypothetical protein
MNRQLALALIEKISPRFRNNRAVCKPPCGRPDQRNREVFEIGEE